MSGEPLRSFEFGPYSLDLRERLLRRGLDAIPLTPKAFDALAVLILRAGHLVSKDELIEALWPESHVEENNLAQCISMIRRALNDGNSYIQTVPRTGYRFVGAVREIGADTAETRVDSGSESLETREGETRGGQAREGQTHEGATREGGTGGGQTRESRTASHTVRWWAAAVATLVAAGSVIAWVARPRTAAGHGASMGLARLTFDSGLTMTPALSPDGTLIAYASDRGGTGHLDIWVQPLGGSDAVRLTQDSTDCYAPAFSPDGRTIAFRAERAGGGIYTISARGGEARLVAPNGRRPRFSPDGKWIAYWVGTETGHNAGFFMVPGAGKTFLVSATGGAPREIQPAFAAAGYPIWTPDGRHLLFLGNRDSNFYHEGTMDWWVTDLDSGATIRTGAGAAFKDVGFSSASQVPEVWTADETGVLVSATQGDSRNIWRVPISTSNWKVSGQPERATFGTTMDMQPSIAGNRLLFASLSGTLDVWGLPVDVDRADPKGDLERLTDDAFAHGYPAVSADGNQLAFGLLRSGNRDIWIKDLRSGRQRQVSMPPGPSFNPSFSPDGTALAYRVSENSTSKAYVVSLAAGGTQAICDDCSDYGWSSDEQRLVLVGKTPARVSILDLGTRRKTALLEHATYELWNARFSPDDRWVSFNATEPGRSRIFVAPLRDTGLIPEQDWISITDSRWDDKPRWSPDGNTLYFVSERDGFRCIWAQRLDPRKRPRGPAIPVFHAHDSRRSLSNISPGDLSISVARDRIVFNMSEQAGSLWLMNMDRRR